MCGSFFKPKMPSLPPIAPPAPVAPPMTGNTQATARPAGFSEADGRSLNVASSYDRKRVGSSKLRIPIIGGL